MENFHEQFNNSNEEEKNKGDENQMPFKEPLVKSDVGEKEEDKLKEFENNPNKIVRKITLDEIIYRFSDENINLIEAAVNAVKLFKELEDKYHINVPANFLIGKDENNRDALYSIVDKIDGKNFCNLELTDIDNKEIFNKELEDLFVNLIHYYRDKYKDQAYYLSDIGKVSQFMYGLINNKQGQHIYLVDTDPLFTSVKINKDDIAYQLDSLATDMNNLKIILEVDLMKAKAEFIKCAEEMGEEIYNFESIKGMIWKFKEELM